MTYLPFARNVARRHFLNRGGDIELPDLCQMAYAGLLEAIDRFDPAVGAPFVSYAERRVSGSVLDGISKISEVREQISFRNRVRSERAQSFCIDQPGELSTADALRALAEAAIGLALGFMFEGTAIYVATEATDHRADAYESVVWKETVRRVTQAVAELPERDQFVIRGHYLEGVAFETLAISLGVTKGRVSQLHRAALMVLKSKLQNPVQFDLKR